MVMVLPASACPLTVFPSAEINKLPGARGGVVSTGLLLPSIAVRVTAAGIAVIRGLPSGLVLLGADYRHPNDDGNRRRRQTR